MRNNSYKYQKRHLLTSTSKLIKQKWYYVTLKSLKRHSRNVVLHRILIKSNGTLTEDLINLKKLINYKLNKLRWLSSKFNWKSNLILFSTYQMLSKHKIFNHVQPIEQYLHIESEKASIVGFCLNKTCNYSPFCIKCLKTQHMNHQENCLEYNEICKFLLELLDQQNQYLNQLEEIRQVIQKLFLKNIEKTKCQIRENIFSQKYITLVKLQQAVKEQIEKHQITIQKLQKNGELKNYYHFFENDIQLKYRKMKTFKINKVQNQYNRQLLAIQYQTQLHDQNQRQIQKKKAYELFEQGRELIIQKQYVKGLELIEISLEKNDKENEAQLYKGIALYEMKRYEEAIACYDKSIEINPQYDTYNSKGSALCDLKRYEEAITCYDKSIEINPQCDDAYNSKGYALYEMKRYEEAIACYDQSIEINPKCDNIYLIKGIALYDMKRYEEAIVCYDQFISTNSNYFLVYYKKGNSLFKLQQYIEAIACYDKLIEINSNFMMLIIRRNQHYISRSQEFLQIA